MTDKRDRFQPGNRVTVQGYGDGKVGDPWGCSGYSCNIAPGHCVEVTLDGDVMSRFFDVDRLELIPFDQAVVAQPAQLEPGTS